MKILGRIFLLVSLVYFTSCGRMASFLSRMSRSGVQGKTMLENIAKRQKATSGDPLLVFDQTPEGIDMLYRTETGRLTTSLDLVAAVPLSAVTFQNTILAFENAVTRYGNALNTASFLKYVSSDAGVREAADRCETAVSKTFVDIFVRADLYRVLKAYQDKGDCLAPEDAFLLQESLTNFIRNGLELSTEKQKVFVDKKKHLVELETEFGKNMVEYKDELLVTLAELEGMPESYIHSLEKTPEGLYRVTMAYPHYVPFMENAKDARARKKLEYKFNNRGGDRNRELLEGAIALRHELAVMLGKPTHAHYVLERRMAKTPDQVNEFLQALVVKLKPKGQENFRELLELKKEEFADSGIKDLYSWDWRYYENLLKKKKFQVDMQHIKEYFPIEVVLKGLFEIYQTLLGVEFVRLVEAPVWHESVMAFAVKRNGESVSYFYMDLFPREGKYEHAAAFTLINGFLRGDSSYEKPFSSIVANFSPPQEGNPSLLAHFEVETLFHEFGHIMHQVLTTAKYASFSGTSVKTDFVEAPSQMLENWVWFKESLSKLSGHYQDPSQPLPEDLLNKLIQAKLVNVGIRYLRQLSFGLIDMTYHTSASTDSTQVYKDITKEVMLIPIQDGTQPQAGFGHLMGGYDAGYYGYLWSEVFAQDMFTRFEAEGLLNPNTGKDYLRWILQPGGLVDPMERIKGFLGREPNQEAFLRSLGL